MTDKKKNPAAVKLGRLGGLKGGNARAEALTPERRKEISEIASRARWKRETSNDDAATRPGASAEQSGAQHQKPAQVEGKSVREEL